MTETSNGDVLSVASETVLRWLRGTMGWGAIRAAVRDSENPATIWGNMETREAAFPLALAYHVGARAHSLSTSTLDQTQWALIAPIAREYM